MKHGQDPAAVALRRYEHYTADRPGTLRPDALSDATAQRMAIEQAFDDFPEAYAAIQRTAEWRQLLTGSQLHPDEFEAFVRRHADEAR
jgi:hypothetical protein